jgi:hypothetical protein
VGRDARERAGESQRRTPTAGAPRLTSGALFLVDQRSRVGRGSGKLCAVCTSAVAEDDVEYEVPGGVSGTVVAHLACHLVWRQESEAARLRDELNEGGM